MGIDDLARNDDDKHRRLIYRLNDTGIVADRRLANVLARCSDDRPCRSAACIYCGRDFQALALDTVENRIRAPARRDLRGRVSAFTIVPTVGCLAPEDLTASACRRVIADVTAAFDDIGISSYTLSLDISFNEDTTGKHDPHWCAHLHGALRDWLTSAQDEALKKHFPKSRLVAVPVVVTTLDSNDRGPLYSFKPDRGRRVAYLNKGNPKRRPYRDTHRRDLRPWQAVQLAHVEHELGFDTRLLISGIDDDAFKAALDAFYRARDGPSSSSRWLGTAPSIDARNSSRIPAYPPQTPCTACSPCSRLHAVHGKHKPHDQTHRKSESAHENVQNLTALQRARSDLV